MVNSSILGLPLLLLLPLGLVNADLPEGNQCKEGDTTSFDNGCNTCVCSYGNWACTEKFCLPEDGRIKRDIEGTKSCRKGETTTFDYGCNTCFCMGTSWACTTRLCLPLNRNKNRVERSASAPKECSPGETKKEACNNCWCTETGLWICTKKACPPEGRQGRSYEPVCKDGDTTSFDGCNQCVCGDGNWACTLIACSEHSLAKREALPPKECTPGETKLEACNKCWCTETGFWICHKKACQRETRQAIARRSDEPDCKEGETTSLDGCNKCFCARGRWACTLMACYKKRVDKREASLGECTPGAIKQEDCNSCICTETAIWVCTLKGCSKKKRDVFNALNHA